MEKYYNNDPRLGHPCVFTIDEMIAQYKMCGWDEYETEEGTERMSDEEIKADILTHDIEEVKS